MRNNTNHLIFGKVPPQAIDLEMCVIGACLLERDTFQNVMAILHSHECFYADAHQKIWETILLMQSNGTPIDIHTVTNELRNSGKLEIVGGVYYLMQLTDTVLSSAHIEAHARIVFEKFTQREIIRICGSMIADAYDDSGDAFELLERAESEIKAITDGISSETGVNIVDEVKKISEKIHFQKTNKTPCNGVMTGIEELDRNTNGWQKDNLIILAARPSRGKSALALNFARNANLNNHCRTLLFSLEMSPEILTKRLISTDLKIKFENIMSGNISDSELNLIDSSLHKFSKLPITINNKATSLPAILSIARKTKQKHADLQLIVIDYLQLIKPSKNSNKNREQEVAEISRELKLLSTELEIPIIALAQMNRNTEKNTSFPQLSDLRESGAIEQDADIVIFVHWESTGDSSFNQWLVIAKNRNGKCENIKVKFMGDYQIFLDPNDSSYDYQENYFYPNNGHFQSRENQKEWDNEF